ncbi:MAG: cell envelope integrity protein CreD [Marinobacter sp.]|uniref:cell envelope integrity protein CreD n=1 Tax=Marinobacter sp. TaxID=50741 RepID=UPI003299B230
MQKLLAIKLGVISTIALLLLIPITLVQGKIAERAAFKNSARHEIAKSWTASQRLMTPVLVLPYSVEGPEASQGFVTDKRQALERKQHYALLLPERSDLSADMSSELRRKGIYEIPVYAAAIQVEGHFDSETISRRREAIAQEARFLSHGTAFLTLLISDPRGLGSAPDLHWAGKPVNFKPGSGLSAMGGGMHAPLPPWPGKPEERFTFKLKLMLKGMESLGFIPAALESKFDIRSDWPHPKFEGGYAPLSREVSREGFTASWRVNQFSTDIAALMLACEKGHCDALQRMSLGVNLIEPVDSYLQSERSSKYGILFVGLSFIAFFMFEILRKLRIHPIQYTLVGLAIAIFYLLLLSLSEHLSFGAAYALAASSCIALLSYYVRFVLRGIAGALLFTAMLSTLYGVLYVIIQAEDFALLGGSVLVFAILAGIMVLTRDIDWYALRQ